MKIEKVQLVRESIFDQIWPKNADFFEKMTKNLVWGKFFWKG